MATATYVPIATQTLGSGASSITFSSIPSGYIDLRLVFSISGIVNSGDNFFLQFNGDTGANYSHTHLYGNGSAAGSSNNTSVNYAFLTDNATGPNAASPKLAIVDIFSYTGSTNKTLLSTLAFDQNGSGGINAGINLWRNTSAITSIKLFNSGPDNFSVGTTATLWGI